MILVPCTSPQLSLSGVWEKQGHTDLQHRRGLRKEAQEQDNLQNVNKALWPLSECSPLLSLLARQCGSLARAQVPMSAVSPHRHATYVFPGDLKAQWAWKPAAHSVTDTASLLILWKGPSKKGCQLQGGCGPPRAVTLSPRDHSFTFFKKLFYFYLCVAGRIGNAPQHVVDHSASLSRRRLLHSQRLLTPVSKSIDRACQG